MATGNLIFHTGTDWTGGPYEWPITPLPDTILVNASGYIAWETGFGMWGEFPVLMWYPTNGHAAMSLDASETRYNLWFQWTTARGSGIIAVIEEGGNWSLLFIGLPDESPSGWTESGRRTIINYWYTDRVYATNKYVVAKYTASAVDGTYARVKTWANSYRPIFALSSVSVTPDGSVTPAEDPSRKLAFTQQPSSSTPCGDAFAQQPVVEIRDMDDDLIDTATDDVTLFVSDGAGTLAGTATVAAVAGVATFTGLSLDVPGTDKVLAATTEHAAPVDSSTFTITPLFQLMFTQQPSASTASGETFAQQPVIEIRDMDDDLIDTAADDVTLYLKSPLSGDLQGTVMVAAVAGVATFTGLGVDAPVATDGLTSKVLTAYADGAYETDSTAFIITPLFQLVFTTQPSASTVAGSAFAQQPVVEIRDMDDDLIDTATDEVTISLADGDGALSCTLTDEDGNKYEGPLTVAAVAGVATFTGLSIDTAGADKVIAVSAEYAEPEESDTFAITAPQTLAFATQPSASTAAGVAFAQQPAVEIKDNTGSRNTSATDDVTLLLFSAAGTLTGTATVAAVAGLATFSGLAVDAAGSVNTLMAVCDAAESVESDNFEIT
jgi:hypothetical protein